jgi:hypothetical protein
LGIGVKPYHNDLLDMCRIDVLGFNELNKRSIGLNPFEDVIVSEPSSEMITLTLNKITGIFQHVLWHGSLHNNPKKCCFVFRNLYIKMFCRE